MPPKDLEDATVDALYFWNGDKGRYEVLAKNIDPVDIDLTTQSDEEMQPLVPFMRDFEFSFAVNRISNNFRRLHGKRPIRHKVRRHKGKVRFITNSNSIRMSRKHWNLIMKKAYKKARKNHE